MRQKIYRAGAMPTPEQTQHDQALWFDSVSRKTPDMSIHTLRSNSVFGTISPDDAVGWSLWRADLSAGRESQDLGNFAIWEIELPEDFDPLVYRYSLYDYAVLASAIACDIEPYVDNYWDSAVRLSQWVDITKDDKRSDSSDWEVVISHEVARESNWSACINTDSLLSILGY